MASWPPTPAVTSKTRSLISASSSGITRSRIWWVKQVYLNKDKQDICDVWRTAHKVKDQNMCHSFTFWLRSWISCKQPSLSSSASSRRAGSSSMRTENKRHTVNRGYSIGWYTHWDDIKLSAISKINRIVGFEIEIFKEIPTFKLFSVVCLWQLQRRLTFHERLSLGDLFLFGL